MSNSSINNIIAIIVILLLLLMSGIFFFQGRNSKKELNKEKLASQTLLENSEKLNSEIKVLKDEFNNNNEHLNELITEKERLIDENNAKIQRLISENKSENSAKKQIKEIEAQNLTLQSEIKALKEQLSSLTDQAKDQANIIAGLEDELKVLKKRNELLTSMISNNIKITATKGKRQKLTVMASRANLISAQLDIPASTSNMISFTIEYPDGTSISSKNEPTATIKIADPTVVKDKSVTGYNEAIKSLVLNYVPNSRLKKGVYKLSVYNGDDYITGVFIGLK